MNKVIATTIFVPFVLLFGSIADAQPVTSAHAPAPRPEAGIGLKGSSGFRPSDSPTTLRLPAPDQFGAHGTFSTWISLDDPASASSTVFSGGTPGEGWILLQIDNQALTLLIQRGERPFSGDGECYINVSVPIDSWAASEWHHLAVSWDYQGPDQSLVVLFVDGEIVEERMTATLAADWGPETIHIGSNSANAAAPGLEGVLDNVAVFPYAVTPGQVEKLLSSDVEGAALFLDFEAGTDASDLRNTVDDAAARATARAQWSSR